VKWIELQNDLRTDTSWVIFKQSRGTLLTLNNVPVIILHGHVGAMYLNGREQTRGSSDFHGQLEGVFNANLSIGDSLDRIKGVFTAWVWQGRGESLTVAVHPGLVWRNRLPLNIPANLSSLENQQNTQFSRTEQMLEDLKRTYG
jgi:hypothetical protein